MSGLVVALALASAAMHAAWNALLKGQNDKESAGLLVVAGAMVLAAIVAVTTGSTDIPRSAWPAIIGTGVLEGIYFVSLLRALTLLPLSTAYGVGRGVGVLFMWPAAVLVLHESVSYMAAFGVVLLVSGLFATMQAAPRGRGLAWALLCALMVGGYPLTYKYALAQGAPPFSVFALSLSGSLIIQFAALTGPRAQRLKIALAASPGVLGLASALCCASFIVWLFALQRSGAAHVAAIRNTSVLMATLFGWIQGEPRTARSLIAAVCIAAGALFISF